MVNTTGSSVQEGIAGDASKPLREHLEKSHHHANNGDGLDNLEFEHLVFGVLNFRL